MYERPLEAVDFYKDGWAPRIFLFREDRRLRRSRADRSAVFKFPREVDVQMDVMERLGVPRDRDHDPRSRPTAPRRKR